MRAKRWKNGVTFGDGGEENYKKGNDKKYF